MRFLYSILIYLYLPVIFIKLLWRSHKAPDYRKRWNERFGFSPTPQGDTPKIWLHAVSMGETLAAIPLIKSLQKQFSSYCFVITTTTPTGSQQVKNALGNSVFHVYMPYDLPGATQRFLSRIQPCAAIMMETELWPNMFAKCRKKNIPIMIANARLSEKSFLGYHRFKRLSHELMQAISQLAAQTQMDADHFIRLGLPKERITITGSIKYDLQLPSSLLESAESLRQQWGVQRAIWIAASTHEGEEEIILSAFATVKRAQPDALLVLVPRHPERFGKVAALSQKHGYNTLRRTAKQACTPNTDVFIGDTMGELLLFYAASDVAFVGGSLIPRGGHNPLEPAALGLPVIVGPHTFNFLQINQHLHEAGGLLTIEDTAALSQHVISLLQDQTLRVSMGEKGRQLIEKNRGSLTKHLELISHLIR